MFHIFKYILVCVIVLLLYLLVCQVYLRMLVHVQSAHIFSYVFDYFLALLDLKLQPLLVSQHTWKMNNELLVKKCESSWAYVCAISVCE